MNWYPILMAINLFNALPPPVSTMVVTDVNTGHRHIYHAGEVVDPDDQLLVLENVPLCK